MAGSPAVCNLGRRQNGDSKAPTAIFALRVLATACAYVQKPAGERKSADCTLPETALHYAYEQDDSPVRSRRQPRQWPCAVRASQGALGLFAAGRGADHPAARQAGGRQRLSGARPDRHQQPVRRAWSSPTSWPALACSRSLVARCRSISAIAHRATAFSAPAPTSRARSQPGRWRCWQLTSSATRT